jgi:hypothetical protein
VSPDQVHSAGEYQRLPHVVARIREFCGLRSDRRSGCVFVTGMGPEDGPHVTWGEVAFEPPERLDDLLAAGKDVARSMWDRENLIVYVDLDYRNADAWGEAYLHPADTFLKLEPTYRAFWESFDALGMPMLDLMTGAGYSLLGRVPLAGPAVARLHELAGQTPRWFGSHDERRPPWASRMDERTARAHRGLGLVLEHLLHRTLRRAASASPLPVVVNNVDVGLGPTGRESVSIDLTHMGDPLDSRMVRTVFGVYQKHRLRPDLSGGAAAHRPPLVIVPRRRRPLFDALESRDPARAAELADTGAAIPNVEPGLLRLIREYEASGLAPWHREYDRVRPHEPEEWPDTYDRLDLGALPPCAAACLAHPNDLLLRPAHIQLLVRVLLARGWHAGHVAGLVWSRYARPGTWGGHWRRVDPCTRAEYDVRVFAGMIAMGLDEGIDFNCVSTREKGMCCGSCPLNLLDERERLMGRK